MTLRPLIVPVDLGGSPHQTPLHPPLRAAPTPDLVEALVHHYETERRTHPDQPVEVAFFHGGLPGSDLLAATRNRTVRVACLPGDLSLPALTTLASHQVQTIELDVGTHCTATRRAIGRRLSAAALTDLVGGLRDRGFRVGMVLSPGLPGSSPQDAIDDAVWASQSAKAHFVRLQPALAWRGTLGGQWAGARRWTPMTVSEAVTTLESMMDVLDQAGVEIARVGLQPGPDLAGTVVAGPVHPNLRALVEYRRFRRRMKTALAYTPRQREVMLRVHPADLAWAKGEANANIRGLRAELALAALTVTVDPTLARGAVALGRCLPKDERSQG